MKGLFLKLFETVEAIQKTTFLLLLDLCYVEHVLAFPKKGLNKMRRDIVFATKNNRRQVLFSARKLFANFRISEGVCTLLKAENDFICFCLCVKNGVHLEYIFAFITLNQQQKQQYEEELPIIKQQETKHDSASNNFFLPFLCRIYVSFVAFKGTRCFKWYCHFV